MICFHSFICLCFLTCQILQLNAFDEEHNDIFAELWQKSDENGTKSGKCEKTLRTNSNDNLISQKIGKIKKEIVVKDEPNDYDEFDQFSNERQQKIALNKTVKEENVEKRVKSEFMEFDRIFDKEEFDNGKDVEERTDSYSMVDNSNLKESSSKSQKGIRKIYSDVEKHEIIAKFDKLNKTRANGMSYDITKVNEKFVQKLGVSRMTIYRWKKQFGDSSIRKKFLEVEKQEIIAEFDKLKKKLKTQANGMSYDIKTIDEKIAQKLGVAIRTIFRWKNEFGAPKKQKKYTDAEKVELLKNFYKIKKENPQLRNVEIAQMLNINIKTVGLWEKKSKVSEPVLEDQPHLLIL